MALVTACRDNGLTTRQKAATPVFRAAGTRPTGAFEVTGEHHASHAKPGGIALAATLIGLFRPHSSYFDVVVVARQMASHNF